MNGIPYKELRRLLKEAKQEEKEPPLNRMKDLGNGMVKVDEENWSWSMPLHMVGKMPYIVEQVR